MPPPYSPTIGSPFGYHTDHQGFELRRATLWNVTLASGLHATDGAFGYRTNSGNKRLVFYDTAKSGGAGEVDVLRGDAGYNEQIAGQWGFTFNSGAPFTVTSTTKVSNLNAHYLADTGGTGRSGDTAATANTVAIRDSNGRLKATDPSASDDVVNYGFLGSYVAGVRDPKDAARVATTANLAATRSSNTLTATANASINTAGIDGVTTLAVNDRVLVKDQTTGADRGIYIITDLGSAGTPWVMQRSSDADTSAEVTNGLQIWITEGTDNGSTGWLLTTADPITLNTTSLTFIQVNGTADITAGNGIIKAGNTLSVKLDGSSTFPSLASGLVIVTSSSTLGVFTATQYGVLYMSTTGNVAGTIAGVTNQVLQGSSTTPVWSGFLLTGTTGGTTNFAVTNTKTLTLTATDTYNLTIPETGTATLGTGASTRLGVWSGTNTIASDANLTWSSPMLSVGATSPVIRISSSTDSAGKLQWYDAATGTQTAHLTSSSNGGNYLTQWDRGPTASGNEWIGMNAVPKISFGVGGNEILQIITTGLALQGAKIISTSTGALTLSTGSAAAINFNINSANAWSILSTGVFQAAAAQSITTAAGALTIQPASGSGLVITLATTGDFVVNTNHLVVDTSAGFIGIGTAAPTSTLHVLASGTPVSALTGVTAWFQRSTSTSTAALIGIVSGNAANAGILFGDTDDQEVGYIKFDHTTNKFTFNAGGGLMTLNASGVIGTQLTASSLVQTNSSSELVSSNDLPAASTIGSKTIARGYAANVGNGSDSSITVTHNLGTRDVIVQLHDAASPYDVWTVDCTIDTTNAVTLKFGFVPTSNQFRVKIVAAS